MMIEIVTIICYNITRKSQIQAEKIRHQGKNNMLEKDQWIIHQADLDRYKGMIRQENRTAFRLMTVTGCVLSIFNLITQIVITGFGMPIFRSCILLVCFSLLFFLDRVIIPEGVPLPTQVFYLTQAPVLLLSVLLGTVWDPEHQATTILLFMMASPVFILDHPNRSLGIMAGWTALFIILSQFVKKSPVKDYDLIHAIEFLVGSISVTYTVVRIRMKSMKERASLQYSLYHDRDTECQNRYALEEKLDDYVGKPLTAIMSDVDQLMLFSDFYGEPVANDIMNEFVTTLMDCYGKGNTFHYGEDDVLCLLTEVDREQCDTLAAECRKAMHGYIQDGYRIAVTFAQGRVDGTPSTKDELLSMIHLAQIYSHRAGAQGRDENWCDTYSQEALAEASADANVASHNVKAFEINPLSGLPTMTYFCMRVDELLINLVDMASMPVVGYFKLSNLKEYNDEFGYQQGDKLIADVGKALKEAFPYRLVGHITAGQYCFFCYLKEAGEGIDLLLDMINKEHPEFEIRGKAGFAEYNGRESATELLDLARIAQRSILNRSDTVCCQYNLDLDEELRFRQYIVNHLDEAIRKEWLEVYYQPIVRADTEHICCEEALSRWNDPGRGFLMPFQFIPPLEENGLMYKLNLAVVERVMTDRKKREESGIPVVPVSVNLSRNDFLQCDMVKEIADRVTKAGYTPDVLRIEITESAFVANQELLSREVKRFRDLGFRVWMDDFGSEYSTLNLLQELDFNLIKIDMKFMNNLAVGEKNHIIVSNAIRMIRELGSGTLMEGVETKEQEKLLQDMGCGLLQGYLFDKPRPFDRIVEAVENGEGLTYETPEEGVAAP